ncbi:MAG: hypothetical protein FJY37_18260, partial [Betaproteobacteria bacterium]|nr:hypothetical protein [Betaproteobacteria bacterium]
MTLVLDGRILLLLATFLLGGMVAAPSPASAFASHPYLRDTEEIVIRANGEGVDPSAAKLDATREALKQAVGMFVDAQTVVTDDQVISDKILSGTNALVLGSKVISGPKRRSDGLYEVQCEVKIRRQQLVSTISAAGIAVTGAIDGDAAQRVSEINFKNDQEAKELLRDRLSNLWSKLMVARLIDDKGSPLGDGEIPTVVQRPDGSVVVCANLQVYFHLEAFYTKFAPDLKQLLAAISKSSTPAECNTNRPIWKSSEECPFRTRFGRIPVIPLSSSGNSPGDEPSLENNAAINTGSSRTVWVSDGRDATATNEHFSGYTMASSFLPLFAEASKHLAAGQVRIELLDESAHVIHAEIVPILGRKATFRQAPSRGCTPESQVGQLVEVDAVCALEMCSWLIHMEGRP